MARICKSIGGIDVEVCLFFSVSLFFSLSHCYLVVFLIFSSAAAAFHKGTSGIELEPLFGIIVNKQISWLCGLFKSRHWFALPKVGGIFHHCDSVAAQTNPFESPQHVCLNSIFSISLSHLSFLIVFTQLFDFLQQIIEDWNGEILLITRTESLAASSDPPARDPAAMIGHTDTTPEVALGIRNLSPTSSSSSLKSAATPPLSESPFSSAAAPESLLNVADSSPQLNFPPVCLDPLPSLESAPLLVADFPAVPQSPLESPAELIPPC